MARGRCEQRICKLSTAYRSDHWVLTKIGTNPTVIISTDFPIEIGQDGNLYYASRWPGELQIVRTTPSGITSVFATLPRKANGPSPEWINGITAGPDNSIYYTDKNSVGMINARGQVSTVVTVPALVGGPSIRGSDHHPYLRGLSVDAKGVVYVADDGDARVVKITPEGKVTTLLQLPQGPWAPTAVSLYRDDLYVIEFTHDEGDDRVTWMPRVRKIKSDGTSTIIVTVDQMPGARPKSAELGIEFLKYDFVNPFLVGALLYIDFNFNSRYQSALGSLEFAIEKACSRGPSSAEPGIGG